MKLSVDEEILVTKVYIKDMIEKSQKLLETLDFSDNPLNLKHSETATMLREFNYNKKLFPLLRKRELNLQESAALQFILPKDEPVKLTEAIDIYNNVDNIREAIESALVNPDEQKYRFLARAYIALNELN